MRAVITGSTGFLGSHLSTHLADLGWDVILHRRTGDPSDPRVIVGSSGGAVASWVRENGADVVFHLATHYLKSHDPDDIAPLLGANVTFGTELFDGLVGTGTTVVSTMSFFQFEHTDSKPLSLYAATKQAFLEIGRYYRDREGLDVREVVLYDSYGPGDTRDKLVPILVNAVATGTPVTLGSPDQPINLLHASDVVAGIVAGAALGGAPTTTVRAGSPVTVAELVSAMEQASGTRLDVSYRSVDQVNSRPRTAGDWPLPVGWAPRVELVAGLTECLEFVRPEND